MSRGSMNEHGLTTTFDPTDKIRILVVGDAGVGKTSLVHALCQGEPLRTPVHTVGCSVDVKIHRYTRTNRNYFVEFLDIGGSSKQRNSRSIFYPNANGVILVHDATNKKSYQNLWRWIAEVFNAATFKSGTMSPLPTIRDSMYKNDFDVDVRVGESRPMLPILVVGTKTDLITDTLQRRRTSIADEYGGDCINLSTFQPLALNPVTERIDSFLDGVIDSKTRTPMSLSHGYSSTNLSASAPDLSGSGMSGQSNISPEMQRRRIPPAGMFGLRPGSPSKAAPTTLAGSTELWRAKPGEGFKRPR